MRIGITGAAGFLGWHLARRFELEGHEVASATRSTFADPAALQAFVTGTDAIVHAAGINRANDEAEIRDGNPALASQLVTAMQTAGVAVPLVYTNSTQSEHDNLYGNAKQAASQVLAAHQAEMDAPFIDLVLPHLFGEFGRPNYNSVVSTFAHALATGIEPNVHRDGQLELLHAQDVAAQVLELLVDPSTNRVRANGRPISVGEVWDTMQAQASRYMDDGTIPDTADKFELQLFNTLRSQLYAADHYPIDLTLHADARGAFSEMVRADGLGQTSISTSVPGITRGDHFHLDKIERFVVIRGTADIKVRQLGTEVIKSFAVSGDAPVVIDMPTLCTHNITNTGDDELITLFWAADHFDPGNPDTYVEPVEIARAEVIT